MGIMSENLLINKRVVLTTNGNVSFAGVLNKISTENDVEGYFIETDSKLGVCIWCPLDSVKELLEIPID